MYLKLCVCVITINSVWYALEQLFLGFHYKTLWTVPIELFHNVLFFVFFGYPSTKRWS